MYLFAKCGNPKMAVLEINRDFLEYHLNQNKSFSLPIEMKCSQILTKWSGKHWSTENARKVYTWATQLPDQACYEKDHMLLWNLDNNVPLFLSVPTWSSSFNFRGPFTNRKSWVVAAVCGGGCCCCCCSTSTDELWGVCMSFQGQPLNQIITCLRCVFCCCDTIPWQNQLRQKGFGFCSQFRGRPEWQRRQQEIGATRKQNGEFMYSFSFLFFR